jgi:hypothetical protein
MKKAELMSMLQKAKNDPKALQEAIDKLNATRGMQFTSEPDVKGLKAGRWYTVNAQGQAVSIPATKTKEGGKVADLHMYYASKKK